VEDKSVTYAIRPEKLLVTTKADLRAQLVQRQGA
jgi:hypothetical protein